MWINYALGGGENSELKYNDLSKIFRPESSCDPLKIEGAYKNSESKEFGVNKKPTQVADPFTKLKDYVKKLLTKLEIHLLTANYSKNLKIGGNSNWKGIRENECERVFPAQWL
jgi:hypothetical protein